MTQETERRAQPRVPADFDFQFAHAGSLMSARVQDISVSGVRCLTEGPVPIMTQVHMLISLPVVSLLDGGSTVRSVSCAGAVVRSEPREEAGSGNVAAVAGTRADSAADENATDENAADETDGEEEAYDTAIFFTNLLEADRSTLAEFVTVRNAHVRSLDEAGD